jgi:hypothetical protein
VDRPILTFQRLSQLYQALEKKSGNPKEKLLNLLQTFKCSRNPDIEVFLHKTALEFELRDKSRTYLWLYPLQGRLVVAGYFTLALDVVELPESMSKSLKKKLGKGYVPKKPYLPAYLIGQLGRSDKVSREFLPGEAILRRALSLVKEASSIVGNRLVIVDVAESGEQEAQRLVNWYKSFGFKELDYLEAEGKELIRLYLILK